ncbi:MAG: glycosyltransferase [Ilumatobacteraceae bacterium]
MTGTRFSIVTPVYNPEPRVLEECIASVLDQTFADWELCLVDDGSTRVGVREVLDAAQALDHRIRVHIRPENGGIVAASNDALAMATGEFVAFLDHDDAIEPDALLLMDNAISSDDTVDYLYSDEDYLDSKGRLLGTFLKPDWSPERFRSQMYTCHLSVARRSIVEEVGGFRAGFDGSQDYDLILRITERCRTIRHISEVLYHWRGGGDSVVGNSDAKPYAYEAGLRAVQEHCDRVGIIADVAHGSMPGIYRVNRKLEQFPLVSIVVPTNGSERKVWGESRVLVTEAVRGIAERATYPNIEFVVVYDAATPKGVLQNLQQICGERLKLVAFHRAFNFSEKINLGAASAAGELLLILNDDVEIIDCDFIEVMAALALEPTVGMVGARLLFSDTRLQHAGHIYTSSGPRHSFYKRGSDEPGPAYLLSTQRECSGVTAACAMVRASVFDEAGGFTTMLDNNFNDVDFSLKLRHLGYRIVWTPYASLYHFESLTREPGVSPEELGVLRSRWGHVMSCDPYFSPHMDQTRDDWVAAPFRRPRWIDRLRAGQPPGSQLKRARTSSTQPAA